MKKDKVTTIKPTEVEYVEMLYTKIDYLRGDTTVKTFAPQVLENAIKQLSDLLGRTRVIVNGELVLPLNLRVK